jgi:hypothetical protein
MAQRGTPTPGIEATTRATEDVELVSVKRAAKIISLSVWEMCGVLDSGAVESRWQSGRRLVRVASLRAYVDALPTERPS